MSVYNIQQLMYDVWGSGFVTRWTLLRPGDRPEDRFTEGCRTGLVEPALDGVRSEKNSVERCIIGVQVRERRAGMGAGSAGRVGMNKARGGVTRGRRARQDEIGASDGGMQGIRMRVVKLWITYVNMVRFVGRGEEQWQGVWHGVGWLWC